MVLLLGESGYIAQTFQTELKKRGWPFTALSRNEIDYTRFDVLLEYLLKTKPDFLINAAGYSGKPNVDACESRRAETLQGNTLLPLTIAHACLAVNVPWGHISTGCIYAGAKIVENGQARIEKDMTRPDLQKLVAENPCVIQGYTEIDEPNFSFRLPPCSFYSGTKVLAEEAIAGIGQGYVWRLRMPFDELDSPRNYLSKIQRYAKVYDNVNSISHRTDCVQACLSLWESGTAFGTYNVTNPGFISTRQVVELIERLLKPNRRFDFWSCDGEFYRVAAKTPRSSCVLDVSKLLSTGVKIRPVLEALEDSLSRWKPEAEN
jgi:dTDP-4-dehydrorhamnose reductase